MPRLLDNLPDKALVGMVHVGALPATPRASLTIDALVDAALRDARALANAGFDALIVENMHDAPYLRADRLGPEIVASMTRLAREIIAAVTIPVGVQILSAANTHALAVALATGASFIRCENFVFAHVADEGLLPEAEAGPLLRYRRSIGAQHVRVCCDLKKKHASHALTADISLADAAEAAQFFGADAVIVTGSATAKPTDPADLAEVRAACTLPLLVGSGATPDSAPRLLHHADAIIVGSWIKHDALWSNPVDPGRAERFVRAARATG